MVGPQRLIKKQPEDLKGTKTITNYFSPRKTTDNGPGSPLSAPGPCSPLAINAQGSQAAVPPSTMPNLNHARLRLPGLIEMHAGRHADSVTSTSSKALDRLADPAGGGVTAPAGNPASRNSEGASARNSGWLETIRAGLLTHAPKPLNALQQAAVVAPAEKPLLILAGAGEII